LISTPYVSPSGAALVSLGVGTANLYTILVPSSDPANSDLSSGSYLVIGKDEADNVYVGTPTDLLATSSTTDKYLQVIRNAAGKILPATTTAVPGSLLLIAQPSYLEFTSSEELLPIVYESVEGQWSVFVRADPPEGFVGNPGALSTSVSDSTLQVLQFTIKDVGSRWTSTQLTHRLKHNGKDITVTSGTGMVNKQNKLLGATTNMAQTGAVLASGFVPTEYALHQNYPDPFNPTTIIQYDLQTPSAVTLKVCNVLGQEVATLVEGESRGAGRYEVRFDGSRLASGIYFYRLEAISLVSDKKLISLKKMLLLK
jgi:hypothetical protein